MRSFLRGRLLGNTFPGGKIISPWCLASFQPDLFQSELPRFPRPISVACYRGFFDSDVSLAAVYRPFFYVVSYNPPVDGWGLRLSEPAKILNVLILVSTVLILTNIERTFRAAVERCAGELSSWFWGWG